MRAVLCIIFTVSLLSGCYYDSQEFLFPEINTTCDTSNVTYSGTIQPVLESKCYLCHSNANSASGGGLRLEDYADVKLRADDGSLLGSIAHDPAYSAMPKGGGKLDNCTIEQFTLWINSGSPEN
jgi:hypothetical protein